MNQSIDYEAQWEAQRAQLYDACIKAASDPTSAFWQAGKPREGAAHRVAFWRGVRGDRPSYLPRGSLLYVCWLAGRKWADMQAFGAANDHRWEVDR